MLSNLLMIAGLLALFAVAAALMLIFLPQPLTNSDYLVAGSVATLITLGVVFWTVVRKGPKSEGVFLTKRKKR